MIAGEGRLVLTDGRPGRRRSATRYYDAPYLVLASGSYARTLPGLEIDGERILTSDHAFRLDRLPASAIVLGGGVIGCEFASAWRSFGVEVTIVEALPRLLAGEEPAISAALERAFRKRKITVLTGAADGVMRPPPTAGSGSRWPRAARSRPSCCWSPSAAGRRPTAWGTRRPASSWSAASSRSTSGWRPSVPGVYAVGDLVAGLQLAHRGFAHGIFVAEEIAHAAGPLRSGAGAGRPTASIPRVTYCDPEVASVGLTEEAATARFGVGRDGDLRPGRQRQVADPQDPGLREAGAAARRTGGRGAHDRRPGRRADRRGQLITGWDAFPDDVAGLLHAHPTQSEALGEAHLALAGKPLHTHG